MKRQLLLLSTANVPKNGCLEMVREIRNILGDIKRVLLIPYARKDRDGYAKYGQRIFQLIGYRAESIHTVRNPWQAVLSAEAIYVAGGNTFLLLKELYDHRLVKVIQQKVRQGMVYIGSSAGSNVACPTIKTTNDMPITYPPSLDALNLVPFQINPHYLDPDPKSKHRGETREQRIREFHEFNNQIVVGLREGAMLRIDNDQISLRGTTGAKIFIKRQSPREYKPGDRVDFLLNNYESLLK